MSEQIPHAVLDLIHAMATPRRRVAVTLCLRCEHAIHDCRCEPDGGPEPPSAKVWMVVDGSQSESPSAWEGVPRSTLAALADEAGFDSSECC